MIGERIVKEITGAQCVLPIQAYSTLMHRLHPSLFLRCVLSCWDVHWHTGVLLSLIYTPHLVTSK